jgi:hypothetical protein
MQLPLKLFCSYASEDARLLNVFLTFLRGLETGGFATIWYDGKLLPGSAWNPGIQAALDEAAVIVLLISADFVASDYCMRVEVPRAFQRQSANEAIVVPVLIRPTPLNSGMELLTRQLIPRGLKAVTTWEDQDLAWTAVTEEILAAIKAFANQHATAWKGANPARRVLFEFRALPTKILCVFDEQAEIGRSRDCDIALTRAPLDVGKVHARLRYRESTDAFSIEDLDSDNGTFVDQVQVKTSAQLLTGSRVQLGGRLTFTFMHYQSEEQSMGALVYSEGERELGRYLLAPSRRVGVGTTSGDAIRIPMEDDGLAAGFLGIDGGAPTFHSCADFAEDPIQLRDGAELRALSRWMRVKILR